MIGDTKTQRIAFSPLLGLFYQIDIAKFRDGEPLTGTSQHDLSVEV